MKHITFADKSLLIGDEAADVLLKYAAAVAANNSADTVEVHAISADGNETTATFLLDAGAPLMAETTNSTLPEPDNAEAVQYMRERLDRLVSPRPAAAFSDRMPDSYEDLDL